MSVHKHHSKFWITTIVVLIAIILGLSWLLFSTTSDYGENPAPLPTASNMPQVPPPNTDVADAARKNVIIIQPVANSILPKTFVVKGSAPNSWYFEASFPIQIRDAGNNVIGHGTAHALTDWTQTGIVPFEATTTVTTSYSGPATVVVLKDNPSGLPERDDSFSMPILIQ